MAIDLTNAYYREAFTSGEKTQTTRRALILVPPSIDHRKVQDLEKAINKVYTDRERISGLLNETLARLEKISDRKFPKIAIELRKVPASNVSFAKALRSIKTDAHDYRILVNSSESVSNHPDPQALEEIGISHLVTLSFEDRPQGWGAVTGIGSANVNTTVKRLPLVAVDIMLDIAMFYARPSLVERYGGSLADRQLLSRKKAAFARRRKLGSFYGEISDGTEYFCFASHIRRAEIFDDQDCERYERLWTEFISDDVMPPSFPPPGSATEGSRDGKQDRERIVQEILRRHSRGGQISAPRLRKEIAHLPSGQSYLLVLVSKKPHKIKQRRAILSAMKKKRWRSNMWIIVPYEDRLRYIFGLPFFTFFHFTVS